MRNQSKEIIDKLDKEKICKLLKINEEELYSLGIQEIFHRIEKETKKEEIKKEEYYLNVEKFGLSNYLLSLKEDEVILDMDVIYNTPEYLREFFEEDIKYDNKEINKEYFEDWSEFYIDGKANEIEEILNNQIFVYKNDEKQIIQLVKPILITKYEDDDHHEYRKFKNYNFNIEESFKLNKLSKYKDYKIYCYYFGLYNLSGEAEIFSVNTEDYKMRNI